MTPSAQEEDWREFRARLVKQEQELQDQHLQGFSEGWAHQTPVIEQGSLVLSAVGDHFALSQQYLHKAVIFIFQHDESGDLGLILNRPTAFTSEDFYTDLSSNSITMEGEDGWNVWFGGDSQGITDKSSSTSSFCLHTLDSLSEHSQEVIRGVFLIAFSTARELVARRMASRDDFLLLLGYCAWLPGHLQSEVERGDTWIVAAADKRMLLGELRDEQASLRARLDMAVASDSSVESNVPLRAVDLGNGIDRWQRLYSALGSKKEAQLALARSSGDDRHVDEMLNLWVQRCLIPDGPASLSLGEQVEGLQHRQIKAGSILRGSSSAWILGKPAEDPDFSHFRPASWRPHQYLHKAVLLLLEDLKEGERSVLVMLNGPTLRSTPDGVGEILLGGTREVGEGKIMELGSGEHVLRVEGYVSFRPGILEKLMSLDALVEAKDVDLSAVASAPKALRWRAAAGTRASSCESKMVELGDLQRRKWYKRFFGRDIGADE